MPMQMSISVISDNADDEMPIPNNIKDALTINLIKRVKQGFFSVIALLPCFEDHFDSNSL